MRINPIMLVDSYKSTHPPQYPPGTCSMFDHLESRGGQFGTTIYFGQQYINKEYLTIPITHYHVTEAKEFFIGHFGTDDPAYFPEMGFRKMVDNGGFWPVRIKTVKEGTEVPTRNMLLSLESTGGPETFWAASWLETQIVRNWYPTTVATLSYYCKKIILEALMESANDPWSEIYYKLHDFGGRGATCHEAAGIGGMAHLINFRGSDTVEGIMFAREYYGEKMAGNSIAAAEHSSITSWTRERELLAYRNMVKQFCKPGRVVACVSDSYDIYNAIENMWCDELRDEVKNSGGCIVIRPDSGDPPSVVLKCLQTLERKLGMTKNMQGYKLLPPYFRLIQGDGINIDSLAEILRVIMAAGYSASNLAFGMGGGLLQLVNRDTQKFALKCSEITNTAGEVIPVYKDPVTDPGKTSKSGKLDLIIEGGQFKSVPFGTAKNNSQMVTVFEDGKILSDFSFDEVRKASEKNLPKV
jgi:nicotinamide phosphoribosyltransferase